MHNHNFTITLLSDAVLSRPSVGLHTHDGGVSISATALKAQMRIVIRKLIETYKLESGMEEKLFGFLRKDGALRSAFSVSHAVSTTAIEPDLRQNYSVSTGELFQTEIIPRGTCFSGILQVDAHEGSVEDIAIRTALLSIQSFGRQQRGGYGRCSVDFPEDDIERDWIYRSGKTLESEAAKLKRARIWIGHIEAEVLAYFAGRPGELHNMSPRNFEEFVAAVFHNQGFETHLTPESRDGGFDIMAVRHDVLTGDDVYLVECKRFSRSRPVGVGVVRSLAGVIIPNNATKGIIITTSFFTKPAVKEASICMPRIHLCDYDSIQQWLKRGFLP